MLLVNYSNVDHDGLWVWFEQVFPHVENDALERPGNGQSVFGVALVCFLVILLFDDVPVDDSWLDSTAQVDQVLSSLKVFLVLEVLDWGVLSVSHLVGPLNKEGIGLVSNEMQVVVSDELPDQGSNVLLALILDHTSLKSSQFDIQVFKEINNKVAVGSLLEDVFRLHLNFLPVNSFWLELVNDS